MPYDDEQEWSEEFDDGEAEEVPCPSCRQMIYEETEQCPHCGEWVMPTAARARRISPLWIAAAVLALLAMLSFVIW
jgi:predicted RNA-binding Zn-ribbon protein involved in translation (DUF1610 family)